ncbi:dynein regulatory complex subunit 4 isoform X2 [Thrips palmi]|uniref:Dynein regulatory complex subunit 4 n=1 Tax=Thrips palmi TaxID=161013 RepID=A0A6P8YCA9_THRPL|nr:dynein regulatory complex subunit 4 isoform X2 [Thrips palmi]
MRRGPKKGKGKGGPVDGVDTTSMSREQLEAFSLRLREELDREREERNFFQLERDKLRTFWEITRQQLEENRAQLRNQDRAQDENEEKHQSEIKTYKQKVKHLLYEHQCNLSNVKVERMVALKMAQDEYTAMENELLKDKNDLKTKLREQELAHQEVVRQLKMEQSAEISKMREQFSQDSVELERKYEARLTTQSEDMGLQQSMELAEVEQRKNRQVVELTKSHEKAFNDMKNYYNEITLNNLALISSLKEQMEELKSGHERMEKQLREVQGENKRLTEPLKQAQSELTNLQRQLASYEHDKITLANTKQRLGLVTKELEELRWENEVLELRFEKVEKERNRLHAEFVGAVLDVQQKSGLKSAMLGKKMADLRGGGAVSGATVSGDLQAELARAVQAHDDLLAAYESKLRHHGIPTDDLGFKPLRSATKSSPKSAAPGQPPGSR